MPIDACGVKEGAGRKEKEKEGGSLRSLRTLPGVSPHTAAARTALSPTARFIPCRYITTAVAAVASLIPSPPPPHPLAGNLAPFFSSSLHVTAFAPLRPSVLSRVSPRDRASERQGGRKGEREESERNGGRERVGRGEGRRKAGKRGEGSARGAVREESRWKIVTFRLISSNGLPPTPRPVPPSLFPPFLLSTHRLPLRGPPRSLSLLYATCCRPPPRPSSPLLCLSFSPFVSLAFSLRRGFHFHPRVALAANGEFNSGEA